jgi:hypothetical protein
MKRFLFCAAIILLVSVGAHATTYTAASCSAPDVMAKINLTANGDTVLVPSGTCTWDTGANQVTISSSHQITLNGQGAVTINFGGSGTDPGSGNTALSVTAGTSTTTSITGFTFNGAYINGRAPITLNTAFSPLTQTFRFYSNNLSYAGSTPAGTMIIVNGNGGGLLDHNTFSTDRAASELIHILGEGPSSQASSWTEDVVPGGPINIFLEDNTFSFNLSQNNFGTSAVQMYYGARVVFRHNHVTNMQFDVHGTNLSPGACTVVNGRWFEAYNNDFHTFGSSSNVYVWFAIRGGSGVIFNNTASGLNAGSGAINMTSDCSGGSYPVQDQVGRGISQNLSPTYLWNNLKGGTALPFVDGEGTGFVQAARDYFTSGSQPGTLNRCESAADVGAGCPVSGAYTPYTYPHPLVSSTLPLILTPNPVAFGSQNTGTTSSSASTVTVTNPGVTTAILGSPTFYTFSGTNPLEFPRTGGTCSAGQSLAPAGTCTFLLKFSPAAAGSRTARLNVIGSASGSTDLTGTGVAPGGSTNKVNAATELKNQVPVANGGLNLSTVANHQVPVGTNTDVYTAKTIPDCTDTVGQHINFAQSTNAFSCGTSGPSGVGSVTSFSAGNLSPLFTTSVSNPSTTPALSFSLSNFAAHTFYGNNTGSTAAPAAVSIGAADLPAGTVTTTGSPSSGNLTKFSGSSSITNGDLSGDVTTSGTLTTTLSSTFKRRGIAFSIGIPGGTALTVASTTTDYITVPIACTISGYNLLIDAGTITVKFWKKATGTAIPTSSDSISTSGVGISTGTAIHSTTTSDFTTTTVTANDILAVNVTAVSTAAYLNAVLQCDQ